MNIIIRVWRGFSLPSAKLTAFPETLLSVGALSHASTRSVMEENDNDKFWTLIFSQLVSFLASQSFQSQFV